MCPSTVLAPGDTTETVQAGGLARTYILHVPSAYKGTSPVPLVVDFHPISGSDTGEESASPFKAQTDPEGVITAYPQGEASPNLGLAWNVGPCCVSEINGSPVDDVAFGTAIVAQVETKACIDSTRVYAVGFSMGGAMSHYIACHAADVFAAVSPASFDLLETCPASAPTACEGNVDTCKPTRPIPVLAFRGEQDEFAFYGGGYSELVTNMPLYLMGAQACFQAWASIDGCTGSASAVQAVSDPTANKTWNCQYYKSCNGGVQVGLCVDPNGGHEYGSGYIGWPWLKMFTLP
jgi:polyhydroxybutyrate depolymerase